MACSAGPAFKDRSVGLPERHEYTGGWDFFVGGGIASFDCNGDELIDIFAAGGADPAALFQNATEPGGEIQFEKKSLGDGLHPLRSVTGAYPLDLDNDGFVDLMVLRNGKNLLLKGDGACGFEDATEAFNLSQDDRWSTAFSAVWEADAALPTLAFGNYVDTDHPDAPFGTCDTNWLLRPDGQQYGAPILLEPGYCPLSMLFSDWQRTGVPMLRISNDRQYYIRDGYEQMWSLYPLREWDASDGWPQMQLWGMGIASRDLSGDGLPEVMLTSMGDQMLMSNTGSGFAVMPYEIGTFAQKPFTGDDGRPSTGWHAEFGDIDNDGRADLFIAKGNVDQMPGMAMRDPNNLLMQQADGTFQEMADVAGVASTERSRGAALVDFNNDGLLDLAVVNRRAALEIWQNTTADAGNWLKVFLSQPDMNRHAIGAFVELRIGEIVQTQEVTVGGGHASGSLAPLHFGLGQANTANVRVIWPDGTKGEWRSVDANQTLRLTNEARAD